MKTNKKNYFYISTIFLLIFSFTAIAQSVDEQYAKALKLKTEYKYKEAFPLFQALVKLDSNNIDYLTGASYCYSKYGFFHLTVETEKIKYYQAAEKLAKKAIKINDNSADAHYLYAMALGRINENASSKQKIANAKLIKSQVDKAIAVNSKLAGAYHILGRWHRTIANFSSIEKAMINSFYGGVPAGGTHADAVKSFMTAIAIEPKFMMHQFELAQTYYDMGKKVEAKLWAEKALQNTPFCEDDFKAKKDCEELLKDLK